MAKTALAYIPDRGQVEITLSAANIVAHSEFTTAEAIVLDGAVRSFQRTNNPTLPLATVKVTGSTTPISVVGGGLVEAEEWELVLVDDFTGDFDGGEWGTDTLSAYHIFHTLLYGTTTPSHPEALDIAPDGDTTGKVEYSLTLPKVRAVGIPGIEADSETLNEVTVIVSSETHTLAAIT